MKSQPLKTRIKAILHLFFLLFSTAFILTSCSLFKNDIEEIEITGQFITTTDWVYSLVPEPYEVLDIEISPDGSIVYTAAYFYGLDGDTQYYIGKVNSVGEFMWRKELFSDRISINAIAIDASNNIYVGARDSNFYAELIKLDSHGNIIWQKNGYELETYTSEADGSIAFFSWEFTSVSIAYDGRIILGGWGFNFKSGIREYQNFVAILNTNDSLTSMVIDIDARPKNIIELEDKSLIIAGKERSTDTNNNIIILEKLGSDGTQIWSLSLENKLDELMYWQGNLLGTNENKILQFDANGKIIKIFEKTKSNFPSFTTSESQLYLLFPGAESDFIQIYDPQMNLVQEINLAFSRISKIKHYSGNTLICSGILINRTTDYFEHFLAPLNLNLTF